MKRYEALIILFNPSAEDAVQTTVDQISNLIVKKGGKVETIQKMDRKSFSRVASKKTTSGYYVNIIFSAPIKVVPGLTGALGELAEVFRVLVSDAPAVMPPPPVPAEAA